ncbi:dUTP diphosphatase [Sediminibacillus halophilus]|uniref:Dimeric dUTPase, all-alpha-NTP-PPase (MazG) superfamily n=1 Tax=Sediminibacillus halophilus TaxID=482461 RepID=A0A1G9XIG4_9BACI|nr:dUTP diphosphatase [Sediminibacillus halophilus]SDM96510.1 Dimeric dUTPase, all-alpha-NTP-PPase (MazG) superfamily [Sediminibacillus halophilus]
MYWEQLFDTQRQLDEHIQTNNRVKADELFERKVLALLVETGELANETRCFKFWSKKPKSESAVILEEYVDGLHFILSLGLDTGYRYDSEAVQSTDLDDTQLFLQVYEQIIAFKQDPSKANYNQLFTTYLQLGAQLGFPEEAIQEAYNKKNEVNHQRQQQGY